MVTIVHHQARLPDCLLMEGQGLLVVPAPAFLYM